VALAAARNGIVEIANPDRAPFNAIVARYLKVIGDPREVVRGSDALRWARRGWAASVSTNGSTAHRPPPEEDSIKRKRPRRLSPLPTFRNA
jgi:uncharacterized protein YbjT (DUF2867 family)